jgi:hypothetical protein
MEGNAQRFSQLSRTWRSNTENVALVWSSRSPSLLEVMKGASVLLDMRVELRKTFAEIDCGGHFGADQSGWDQTALRQTNYRQELD